MSHSWGSNKEETETSAVFHLTRWMGDREVKLNGSNPELLEK